MHRLAVVEDDRAHVRSLSALRDGVEHCRACPLWRHATHGVAGAGRAHAQIVLVGEQPGDSEDLAGKPFIGPAGRLLDESLVAAGIDRKQAYVTNAVKHFKWEARGKRRIHKTPAQREIDACMPWLEAERRIVRPEVIVCLGATASKALLGRAFKVSVERGKRIERNGRVYVTTIHPSAILRMIDHDERVRERARFVDDLRQVRAALQG